MSVHYMVTGVTHDKFVPAPFDFISSLMNGAAGSGGLNSSD